MTERPILFSAPMVRALLAGTKTQTRRVVKLPHQNPLGVWEPQTIGGPYGQPGNRLWVRETWMPDPPIDDTWASTEWNGCGRVISEVPERFRHPRFCNYAANWLHGPITWRPSIHMPRWASRILLEVTGVRVERLQDISAGDCISEGIGYEVRYGGHCLPDGSHFHTDDPRQSYFSLWEAINGQGSVEANPWVWAVEFKRVEA